MLPQNSAVNFLRFLEIEDKDLTTPPAAAVAEGRSYIVAASAVLAWHGHDGEIAYYDQTWRFLSPSRSMVVFLVDEAQHYFYTGTAWEKLTQQSGEAAVFSSLTVGGFDAMDTNNIETEEELTLVEDETAILSLTVYHSILTSSGEIDDEAALNDGTGVTIGTRKLVTLNDRATTGVVALDHLNIVNSAGAALDAVVLDADDEFLLVEWNGVKWKELYSSCTLTPA